ncbi:hypothetical protein Ac2012v2_002556 [Leucoagaricus gongylophorus]
MVLQHFVVNSSDLHFSSFVFTLLPFSSNSLYCSCDHQIPSGRSLFDFRTIISLYFGMFRVIFFLKISNLLHGSAMADRGSYVVITYIKTNEKQQKEKDNKRKQKEKK